jgi:hypothetical protein
MTRAEFETMAREQNERRAAERTMARETGAPCAVTPMYAFGGIPYCTTHSVMGPCPYGARAGGAS